MDNDALFPTESDKQMAVRTFQELIAHPGWQLLCQIYNLNIKAIEEQLMEMDQQSIDEVKELKIKRRAYIDCKDTPAGLIKMFTKKEEAPELNPMSSFDPYDNTSILNSRNSENPMDVALPSGLTGEMKG